MKRIAFTFAVGLTMLLGCRSDERRTMSESAPAPAPAPAPAEGVGGGPRADAWSRDGAIDRLSHARCLARERCGAVGTAPRSDHMSFAECVEVARTDLQGSFGASTCDNYDEGKLAGCARELGEAPCGSENKLTDNCVESKLCK